MPVWLSEYLSPAKGKESCGKKIIMKLSIVLLQTSTPDWLQSALPVVLVVFLVFVLDFYIESFSVAKLEVHQAGKISSIASFLFALVIASLWDRPWALTMNGWHNGKPGWDAHVLSGGTVSCAILFVFGESTSHTYETWSLNFLFVGLLGHQIYKKCSSNFELDTRKILVTVSWLQRAMWNTRKNELHADILSISPFLFVVVKVYYTWNISCN